MPRYHYKQAFITSPKLGERLVIVQRVSDGLAILNALDDGDLTLKAGTCWAGEKTCEPRTTIPFRHLKGKNEQAVWDLFDGEIDVAIALLLPTKGRQIDPSAKGRWPNCPPDILAVFTGIQPDSVYRLRHFGALVLANIRIGEYHFSMRPLDRAVLDARLTELERTIAFKANLNGALSDLLFLR